MSSLSEKRSAAGKLGAAARWGKQNDGKTWQTDGKPSLRMARPAADLVQGRTDWYRIKNLSDVAEVYIYDEIGYFGITASDFVRDLQGITHDKIDLHLNTPGGDVFDGVAIYNALKSHKAEVTVIVDSLAASAGSFIAQAGDKVVMKKNATMMIHDASGLAIGNASDMRDLADLLDKTSDNIASIYSDRAGGTVADWRAAMQAETWYSADEAVKAGLADGVDGEGKNVDNTWDLSIFNYAGRSEAPAPEIAEHPALQFDTNSFSKMMREALT
jgi:ATP-dependent Clp endopeptidase proteolytic subunit ClpP